MLRVDQKAAVKETKGAELMFVGGFCVVNTIGGIQRNVVK